MSIKCIWNHGFTAEYKFGKALCGVKSGNKRPDRIEVSMSDIYNFWPKSGLTEYLTRLARLKTDNQEIVIVL